MALWEITTGRDEPYLYVELRGKHVATSNQSMPWLVIEATAHDALSLYSAPTRDSHHPSSRIKGDQVAEGTVQEHCRHVEGPTHPTS